MNLAEVAISVGVITLVFALMATLTGQMADIATDSTSYGPEESSPGALPSIVTAAHPGPNGISNPTMSWENNAQNVHAENLGNGTAAATCALPKDLDPVTNRAPGTAVGIEPGSDAIWFTNTSTGTDLTLTRGLNYTINNGTGVVTITNIAGYECIYNYTANYTEAALNTTLSRPGNYTIHDADAGELNLSSPGSLWTVIDDVHITYKADELTQASNVSRTGAKAQLQGATFIPILIIIAVIVFMLGMIMRLKGT